jgi:hypothetical protein
MKLKTYMIYAQWHTTAKHTYKHIPLRRFDPLLAALDRHASLAPWEAKRHLKSSIIADSYICFN